MIPHSIIPRLLQRHFTAPRHPAAIIKTLYIERRPNLFYYDHGHKDSLSKHGPQTASAKSHTK